MMVSLKFPENKMISPYDLIFVGAVMLSVSYKLLMVWVDHSVADFDVDEAPPASPDP